VGVCTYSPLAVGARAGQKVFSLQTVPARAEEPSKGVAQYARFSLHAGIGVEAEQREKLERLTRYVSRPPVAIERLDLTAQGQVRVHLTRYHGVFAANAALRAAITPAGRGSKAPNREPERPTPKHVAQNWARRLQRVFGIEIEQRARCGGRLEVIGSIEEPELIERILTHGREQGGEEASTVSLGARAPPQASLL
jgi:hypothetical protein